MNKHYVLRAFPDGKQEKSIRNTLLVVAGFVAVMTLWAAIAEIPEVAKTRGEVVPLGGDIDVVESLSGGKILRVLVKEGDVVTKGQVIANLDQAISEADIRRLDIRHADLAMKIESLRALEQKRQPNFGAEGEQFPGLAAEELGIFESESKALASQLLVIDDQIVSKQEEIESAQEQMVFTAKQMRAVDEQLEIMKKALEQNLAPRARVLEQEAEQASLNKEREELEGRIETLQSELVTLREQRRSAEFEERTEYRTQRAEYVEQLKELEEELIQAHASVGQNALVAPEDGIIKSLPNLDVGSIIEPGGVVAELVPSDQPLEVEVRVSPRDIGFIRVGQSVLIKVDAYDYSRFGAVEGTVTRVSPSTFEDERTGQPYFMAVITPVSEFVGDRSNNRQIRVGMTTEADITTGHKTVFQYLLKPVYTTIDTALTEH